MKKTSLLLAVVFCLCFLSGCFGGDQSPQATASAPDDTQAPSAQPSVLTVAFSNSTDYIFNEIYISPTAANDWGEELLGSTRILKSSGAVEVDIPAYDYENYDIMVVDEDEDEYKFTYVPLQDGNEVIISFGEEGLTAAVNDREGNEVSAVLGSLASGGGDAGESAEQQLSGDGDAGEAMAQQPSGTGHDTNGQYAFTVFNESDYDIYAIHMGTANSSADNDIDILPQILPAGQSTEVTGTASEGDWANTEWSLYITDVDDDESVSYDSFNPWTVSYVNVHWDADSYGYVCEFVYPDL